MMSLMKYQLVATWFLNPTPADNDVGGCRQSQQPPTVFVHNLAVFSIRSLKQS